MHLKSIIYELLWFLKGDTNVRYLQEHGVRIWNEWADPDGELGHIYGYQWRSWRDYEGGFIDQISEAVKDIKENPDSAYYRKRMECGRSEKHEPPLPCFLPVLRKRGKLSLQLYQRSADYFLGVPFNIASYALLCMMMAQVCGLEPGEFIHTLSETRISTPTTLTGSGNS